MSLEAFLQGVVEVLDEAGVAYMLTGSLAAAFYAVPRATQDIDVVVETEQQGIDRLVRGLLAAGWYADRGAAMEAWRDQGQFNAIDPGSGWKADFIVRKDREYSREEFGRRKRVSLLGLEVPIASLEDLLISKLEWSRFGNSALQRRDVIQLLERTWDQLDHGYLDRWIPMLGLQQEWGMARSGMGQQPSSGETE